MPFLLYIPGSMSRIMHRANVRFSSSDTGAESTWRLLAQRFRKYRTECWTKRAMFWCHRPLLLGCAYVSATSTMASIASVSGHFPSTVASDVVPSLYTIALAAVLTRIPSSLTNLLNKYVALVGDRRPNGHGPSPPPTGNSMNHSDVVCMCARCLDQSIRPRTSCLASCAKMACHAASQKEFVCIHCDMRTHVPTHSSHGLVSSSSPTLEQGIRRLSMPSPSKQSAVSTARISGSSIAQIWAGASGAKCRLDFLASLLTTA